ncbi:MAG: hypothetical protein RMK93_03420 [Bacteroidota bacterium]|nr:hypothetical protein [Bacteroidota bacterium]
MVRWLLTEHLRRRLRRLFSCVYIRGSQHLRPWQEGSSTMPLLLYCSHNGWSDIALAAVLARRHFKLQSRFLISPQQARHLPLLRFLGALTLPWEDPAALQELLPSVLARLMPTPSVALWIFATGDFLSIGETDSLWSCADIVRLAQRPLALAPAVWSYQLLQPEPTSYLWLGQPETCPSGGIPSALVQRCSQRLTELYEQQQQLLASGTFQSAYHCYSL